MSPEDEARAPSLSESIASISVTGSFDDGSPLLANCDDSPITLKMGDDEAVTYWAKETGRDSHGTPTYKLLPMDRA